MSLIKKIRLTNMHWHKFLAWSGAIILCLYLVSAITHPLVSWTGPKAATFRQPTTVANINQLHAIPKIIALHQLSSALVVKVIPSEDTSLLQVTENNLTRRYFDLNTYQELLNYDEKQALWLAEYYTGKPIDVESVSLQTEFSDDYPWVNRLLPVYKVKLKSSDNRVLYIYTELNALASVSNDWKKSLQFVFKKLHTWDFLNGVDNLRVVLIGLMMLTLFLFILSGIGMVFSFKSRKIISPARRWHRRIAYIIWLPLLGFSTSGFYHLLQSAYSENNSGIKTAEPLLLSQEKFNSANKLSDKLFAEQNITRLNQISIVNSPDGELLYRVSLPQKRLHQKLSVKSHTGEHAHHSKPTDSRAERYKGIASCFLLF